MIVGVPTAHIMTGMESNHIPVIYGQSGFQPYTNYRNEKHDSKAFKSFWQQIEKTNEYSAS